jgi:hypothetical protein
MPIAGCGQSTVLTGQDGMISMKPPGTFACLADWSDFSDGNDMVSIPSGTDFRIGDPVSFTKKGVAKLDTAFTAGTVYYIIDMPQPDTVQLAATASGTAITCNGDGGTGSADTPGAGNHIELSFAKELAVCEVASVSLDLSRGEVDRTAIPCKPSVATNGRKVAKFRSYQAGFADGSGSLTIRLTEDTEALNNRIIQGALFEDQGGATLKAYFNAVAATGGLTVDDTASLYMEFPIVLLGFSTAIGNDDAPTEVTMNYRIAGQPTHLLGVDL